MQNSLWKERTLSSLSSKMENPFFKARVLLRCVRLVRLLAHIRNYWRLHTSFREETLSWKNILMCQKKVNLLNVCYIANATLDYTDRKHRSLVTRLKAKATALLKYSNSHYSIIWQPIVFAVVNNESPRQNTIYTEPQRNAAQPYCQTPKSANNDETWNLLVWDTKDGVIPVYGNKTFLCTNSSFPIFLLHVTKKLAKGSFKKTKKRQPEKSSQTASQSTEFPAPFQRYSGNSNIR